jgi:hypothetical protein
VEEVKSAWARGVFTEGRDAMSSAVANAAAVENIQFAERLINMDFDDYLTAMKDGE